MAAEVVQQAWLTLKEYTWPIPITKVKLEDQKVRAYEGGTATKTLFSDLSDIWFPDQVAKHALMCFRYPFMPLVLTESLITQLIKQSEFHIHEIKVELKDPLRTVTFVHANGTRKSNWPFYRLMLLRITHRRSDLGLKDEIPNPNMEPGVQAACVVCGEPARNRCSACNMDTSPRRYCGKACQVKDWPTHKKACKDIQNTNLEKKLTRIVEIVQQGYYDFKKNTWHMPVVRMERHGSDELRLTVIGPLDGSRTGYFVKFPQLSVSDKRTENAILCAMAHNEYSAWMYSIIGGLTEGLDVKVEEVDIFLTPRPHTVKVRQINDDETKLYPGYFPNYQHGVLRVTSTKTRKVWAVDISGAQYGIYQALWTWEECQYCFMENVHRVFPFGFLKSALRRMGAIQGEPTLVFRVAGKVADCLASKVNKDWQTVSGVTLSQMVALDEENFAKRKLELLRFMDDVVRTFVHANDFQAEYKAAMAYERNNPGVSEQRVAEVFNDCLATMASFGTD
ncbi:unnamed protein product [Alternaria sp. RS040]